MSIRIAQPAARSLIIIYGSLLASHWPLLLAAAFAGTAMCGPDASEQTTAAAAVLAVHSWPSAAQSHLLAKAKQGSAQCCGTAMLLPAAALQELGWHSHAARLLGH